MYFAMECSAFNLKTENFHVNQSKVLWLKNQCRKIQDFAQRVVVDVDVVEETWHRKHGSFDFIPAIACEGFPREAKPWLSRVEQKNWPSPKIVEEVMHAGTVMWMRNGLFSKAVACDLLGLGYPA